MNRSFRYNPSTRSITITVPRNYQFRRELLRTLVREELIQKPFINATGRRRKTLRLILVGVGSTSHAVERLADWLSRVPTHRAVHDPWEHGGKPVDMEFAVELVVDAILSFDESTLSRLSA